MGGNMYQFCNNYDLKTLSVYGKDSSIVFETDTEKAVVKITVDSEIESIEHFDKKNNSNVLLNMENSKHVVVGDGDNCIRDVFHWLKPTDENHLQLRVGLTVHRGLGTWSSLPHGFEDKLESDFEEVFFYMLKGGTERAIQVGKGVWWNKQKIDDVWKVENKTFSVIPMGYHPVVAEPNVEVRYIWGYLAKYKHWEKI
jgi:5-deoxy-D-glucuronate isomerase